MKKRTQTLVLMAVLTVVILTTGCSESRLDQPPTTETDAMDTTVDIASIEHAFVDPAGTGSPTMEKTRSFNMEFLGHVGTTWPTAAVSMSGDYAYVTSFLYENPPHSTFEVIDISDPASPAVVGVTDCIESGIALRMALDLFVDDDFAYIADFAAQFGGDTSYLYKIDITQPAMPQAVDLVTEQGNSRGVTASDGIVYDARYLNGLLTWSADGLDLLGQTDINGTAVDVEVCGNMVYVCGTMDMYHPTSTINIVDATDPANPIEIGVKKINATSSSAWDLELYPQCPSFSREQYVCVVDGVGFIILDVTDPKEIVIVSEIENFLNRSAYPVAVEVQGHYAYVAAGYAGVYVYDIISPASPRLCGAMDMRGFARDIDVYGDLITVAGTDEGLVTMRFLGE